MSENFDIDISVNVKDAYLVGRNGYSDLVKICIESYEGRLSINGVGKRYGNIINGGFRWLTVGEMDELASLWLTHRSRAGKVWSLAIDHEHGTNMHVCATK